MLALTREPGQRIVIGDDISIMVLSVSSNGRVRLGIEAPSDVRIDREEVLVKIQKENQDAALSVNASEGGMTEWIKNGPDSWRNKVPSDS